MKSAACTSNTVPYSKFPKTYAGLMARHVICPEIRG